MKNLIITSLQSLTVHMPSVKTIFIFFLLLTAVAAFSGCTGFKHHGSIDGSAMTGPIDFYRGPLNHLGAVKEGTCPMHPSCSAYAKEAIDRHGPLTGSIMSFDRLIRCGRDETEIATEIYINNRWRYHDPVRHNDFWWHKDDNS